MKAKSIQWLRTNTDLAFFASLVAGWAGVAAIRLGTYPVYETDESYILQVAYEILNRGKLALPMYRFLGGNIENIWHSFTPLYFFSLSGFLKVFGFGVVQGRVFNLLAAISCLTMVYLLGRRMFGWKAGIIAVVMMMSDPTVLQRARMVRNDYPAEALALLAFYFYEIARQQNTSLFYAASGLAVGAGIMCHPSILYIALAIGLLMLISNGWGLLRQKPLYLLAGGTLLVCLYELVYDLIDYSNLLRQYQGDNLHFGILSIAGLWNNFLEEPTRYVRWYRIYDVTFQTVPLALLHLFQFLIPLAIIYLSVRTLRERKMRRAIHEPRVRLLTVTFIAVLFLAFILHKAGYYNIHIITWFSLCVGVLLSDGLDSLLRWSGSKRGRAVPRAIAVALVTLIVIAYGAALVRQYRGYLNEAQSPDAASSSEIKTVLGTIVPPALCPVAVMAPVLWLSFPDRDQCFATLERRMSDAVQLDGSEYALIMRPKASDHWAWELSTNRHLLAELMETPYGNFNVYYTGTDPSYLGIVPRRFYFFRQWNGYASQEQVDAAGLVWSVSAVDPSAGTRNQKTPKDSYSAPSGSRSDPSLPLSIDLNPRAIYSIELTGPSSFAGRELLVTEAGTGRLLKQIQFIAKEGRYVASDVFRTLAKGVVTLHLGGLSSEPVEMTQSGFTDAAIRHVANVADTSAAKVAIANRQPQATVLIDGQ